MSELNLTEKNEDSIQDYAILTELFSVGKGYYDDLFVWGLHCTQNNPIYPHLLKMEIDRLSENPERSPFASVFRKIPQHERLQDLTDIEIHVKILNNANRLLLDLQKYGNPFGLAKAAKDKEDKYFLDTIYKKLSNYFIDNNIVKNEEPMGKFDYILYLRRINKSQMADFIANQEKYNY
jgi:hypothetical protein